MRGSARTPRSGVTRVGPPSRPGVSASTGSAAKQRPAVTPAPARGSLATVLSWRTLVLAGVLGLAFALVWPSVRVYNDQRASNSALRAERDAAQAEVDDLDAQLARWQDPAYVVAQARERLAYVYPGETPYRVVDPEVARPAAVGSVDSVATGDALDGVPWFDRMWDSLGAAGAEPEPAQPQPQAAEITQTQDQLPPASNVELGG